MYKPLICRLCLPVLLLLSVVSCSSDEPKLTKTERQRLTLDPEAKRFLVAGEQAYKDGRFHVALALSDSAERYAPDLADVHFLRGRIYTDLNQIEIANAAYREALLTDPEYKGAHMNLGVNLHRRAKLHDAIKEFKSEEALGPNPRLYLEMGRVYAQLGVADSAKMAFEQSLALDSTSATTYMWYGQLYEEMGEFDRALEYSRKGLALRPENLDYQYIIGSQLMRMGKSEEALPYLQAVAEQRPWHHAAQYNLGQVLVRLGREKEGQVYLDRATEAQQITQEINELNDELSRTPDDLETWMKLAEAHRKAGMYDKVVEALKVAVTVDPGNLGLHINLGSAMMEAGDTEGAIRRYRLVLELDPNLSDAWLNLGVAYANAGRYDEARKAWERVLQLRPVHRQAKAYLAQLSTLQKEN